MAEDKSSNDTIITDIVDNDISITLEIFSILSDNCYYYYYDNNNQQDNVS